MITAITRPSAIGHALPANTSYRPEVDGLRALAVVAVIINHFNREALPSGYLGVDIFFVISGYVITSSLAGRTYESLWEFLIGFYSRRVKRLVPPLILCVAVGTLLTCLFNPFPIVSLKTGFAALCGISNIYLLRISADYFGVSAELNTFTHTWSLGVEEQFYFIYPFLFWVSGYSKQTKKTSRRLIAIIGAMALASAASAIYFNTVHQQTGYFFMPARLWELGTGCIVYASQQRLQIVARKVSPDLVFALLLSSLFVSPRYALGANVAVVLLSAALIVTLEPSTQTYRIFAYPLVVKVGLLSYSLYLWHWVVLVISRWTIGAHWWSIPFQLATIVALATVSYSNLETRFRVAKWSSSKWKTVAYGMAASLTCAGLVWVLAFPLKNALYTRSNPWKDLSAVSETLRCHMPKSANPIATCLRRMDNRAHVFVLGDSHAANYYWSILRAAEPAGVRIRYLTDTVLVEDMFECGASSVSKCKNTEFTRRLEFIKIGVNPRDLVIFSISRDRIYANAQFHELSRRGSEDKDRLARLRDALLRLNTVVLSVHSRLVLIDDIPKLCDGETYPLRVAQNSENPCSIRAEISIDDRQPLTRTFQEVILQGALYLDPHSYLCGAQCTSLLNGTILYADGSPHFSNYSPAPLVGMFENAFKSRGYESSRTLHEQN